MSNVKQIACKCGKALNLNGKKVLDRVTCSSCSNEIWITPSLLSGKTSSGYTSPRATSSTQVDSDNQAAPPDRKTNYPLWMTLGVLLGAMLGAVLGHHFGQLLGDVYLAIGFTQLHITDVIYIALLVAATLFGGILGFLMGKNVDASNVDEKSKLLGRLIGANLFAMASILGLKKIIGLAGVTALLINFIAVLSSVLIGAGIITQILLFFDYMQKRQTQAQIATNLRWAAIGTFFGLLLGAIVGHHIGSTAAEAYLAKYAGLTVAKVICLSLLGLASVIGGLLGLKMGIAVEQDSNQDKSRVLGRLIGGSLFAIIAIIIVRYFGLILASLPSVFNLVINCIVLTIALVIGGWAVSRMMYFLDRLEAKN